MKDTAASVPTSVLLKPSECLANGETVVVIMLFVARAAIVMSDRITAMYAKREKVRPDARFSDLTTLFSRCQFGGEFKHLAGCHVRLSAVAAQLRIPRQWENALWISPYGRHAPPEPTGKSILSTLWTVTDGCNLCASSFIRAREASARHQFLWQQR